MTGKARADSGRGLAALIPTGPDTTTVADVLINGAPPTARAGAAVPGHGDPRMHVAGGNDRSTRRTGRRSNGRTGIDGSRHVTTR